jgi:hypothetical protein
MFVVTEAEAAAIRAVYEQAASYRPRSSCAGCSQRSSPRLRPDHRRLDAAARAAVPRAAATPEETRYLPACLIALRRPAQRHQLRLSGPLVTTDC